MMSKFIKIDKGRESPAYINSDNIVSIYTCRYRGAKIKTIIETVSTDDGNKSEWTCWETPEEILKQIEADDEALKRMDRVFEGAI